MLRGRNLNDVLVIIVWGGNIYLSEVKMLLDEREGRRRRGISKTRGKKEAAEKKIECMS